MGRHRFLIGVASCTEVVKICYTLREAIDTNAVTSVFVARISTSVLALPSLPLRPISPGDHASILHPAGRGRVTIARKADGRWRETSVPVSDITYAVRHLQGEQDVYLTQNRFHGRRRLVSRLAELDALFIDLDYYKTEHGDAHPQHVLGLALEALEQARIPCPSFAVSSGRGLALIWLHRPVPRAALPRWRACQQMLCRILEPLGADRQATDAARVLRLIGTRNSRSDTLVEAIMPVGDIWDFDLLADEILPIPRVQLIALCLERAKRRSVHPGAKPRPMRWFTAAGLWELRLAELQRLLEHRWFGALPAGQRNLWMLLAGVATSYLVPASVIHREIVALADQATGGHWLEREAATSMSAVIARAEQAARGERIEYRGKPIDPRYRFRTDTIIDQLGITEAEMRAGDFRHLVSAEIRREHHRAAELQRRRAASMAPRQTYEEHSLSQLKPWQDEGISRRTWYRRRGTSPCRCMVAEPSASAGATLLVPARLG